MSYPDSNRYRTIILKQLGLALLYALLLYTGEIFFEGEALVGYFEPVAGLALGVLLIGGKRYVWGIFAGALLANVAEGSSFPEMIAVASADTLQALCGVWLLTRKGEPGFRIGSLYEYLRLIILGGGASVAAGSLLVNTVLLASGSQLAGDYYLNLAKWWMGDTLGVVLITPLVLAWWHGRHDWRETRQWFEGLLLIGLTMLVGQIIFLGWLHDIAGQITKSYWMFMLITWVAMFLGIRGTTTVLFMVSLQALFGAINEVGYFARDLAETHLLNYWFYMLTLSLVGMSLATYFNEIREAKSAAAHRDVLIREIHHRIKNNLQGITGLLRQFGESHPEAGGLANQTIGQVQSIAAVHGLLEHTPTNEVRLREMVEAVAAGIGALWQQPVAVKISPAWIPYAIKENEAVPLALVFNELLSNAIKHGGRLGQVNISLEQEQRSGSALIRIANQCQPGSSTDFESQAGTGLELVKSLLPKSGANLSWQYREQDNTVITLLELESPVITSLYES